jgi:hypothetical protein
VIVRGGLRVESNTTLCWLRNGDILPLWHRISGTNPCLMSLAVIYFCSSYSCIAYLVFDILPSETTSLDLVPEFVLLTTYCTMSYLLIPSWNQAILEFLSLDLLFVALG